MGKTGFITEDYRQALLVMITDDFPKESILAFIKAIPSPEIGPSKKGKRLLPPGVNARYLENGELIHEEKTPTTLAKYLLIKPHKFAVTGHEWDGITYGTVGYRTTLHAFTVNGYEVDIGDGWGDYSNEYNKPYGKFDVRRNP